MKQENAELRGQLEVMKGTVTRLQHSLHSHSKASMLGDKASLDHPAL